MQYVKISLPTWKKIERIIKDYDQLGVNSRQRKMIHNDDTVSIRNDSGLQCQRFNILQISSVVVTPEDSLQDFQQRPVFTGAIPSDTPNTEGRLVICAEPIAPGQIGRAWADGVVMVQIDVTDSGHNHATIRPDDIGKLKSDESGLCYILWKEPGIGTKWAVVRIGGGSGGSIRWAFCAEDAGTGNTLDCFLDKDTTGTPATVYFKLLNCDNLKEGHFTLADGVPIPVMQRNEQWWCIIPIEGTEVVI